MKNYSHAGLFGGIRIFDLAARLNGIKTIANAETDNYCIEVGQQLFGGIEWGDVRTAHFARQKGMVDILTGGFPCQDISVAGKKEGIGGAKSSLWKEFFRAIDDLRPRFAIIENSPNLTKKGLDEILCDLESIGYDAEWENISASEFGADHIRERIWILAYPKFFRRSGILRCVKAASRTEEAKQICSTYDPRSHPADRFAEMYDEPPIFGVYDGLKSRLHVVERIQAVGNSIYWVIPYLIFKTIIDFEKMTEVEYLNFYSTLLDFR